MLETPVSQRMYIEVVCVCVEADDFFDDEPGPGAEGTEAGAL
jgi:hypothetical protein